MEIIKLVPCKYCGSIVEVIERTAKPKYCIVRCPDYHCRELHPVNYIRYHGFMSKLRAYIEWNKVNKTK